MLGSIETGEKRTLLQGAGFARYLPSGHFVYGVGWGDAPLRARPFDLSTLELGDPVVELPEQSRPFSFSATGIFVRQVPSVHRTRPLWLDREGEVVAEVRGPCYGGLSLSPDSERLAFECRFISPLGGRQDIGVWDFDSEVMSTLAYGHEKFSPLWSPDGGVLAYLQIHPETGEDIWLLPMEGDREPRSYLVTAAHESAPRFSPDGHWIAYHSDETGNWHLFVRPYSGPDPKMAVSTVAGGWPLWSRDGMELFHMTMHRTAMMVIDVADEPTLTTSPPRVLFEAPRNAKYYATRRAHPFDVPPDGNGFVSMGTITEPPATELYVVVNWFDELKRLAPREQ